MKYVLIFAYGSLVNFDSAERTLHRKVTQSDVTPAWVSGYERIWNYKTAIYVDALGKETDAVFLNLRATPGALVSGLIFRVNEDELQRLRLREANYDLIDISNAVAPQSNEPVYAFICINPIALADPEAKCIIMKKYVDLVKDGFCKQGDTFYKEYIETTVPFDFKVVEGDYSFSSH